MKQEEATFGAGCFWGVESILRKVDGVIDTEAGYCGGQGENPTYRDVCSGTTGHAEVVKVVFDSEKISYGALLDYFWRLHDPTQLNRQGADIGTQYRSVIFYHSESQKREAEESIKRLLQSGAFSKPIVTTLERFERFFPAEEYHQDYFEKNPGPICHVLRPS